MKTETIIGLVMSEISRAETIHPAWPRDFVKAASICAEECGELVRACNNFDESRGSRNPMVTEAVHTAATAIRFLKNINEEDSIHE